MSTRERAQRGYCDSTVVLMLSEKGGSSERSNPLIVFENAVEVKAFSILETQPISITLTEDAVAVVWNNNEG